MKKDIKNLVGAALDDITGSAESAIPTIGGKRKTKVIAVRILQEDISKLETLIKMETGENSLSAGIRKILYKAMRQADLI